MVERKSLEWMGDGELQSLYSRMTGESTRIVDELVQKFFNEPQGTEIPVVDHYASGQADKCLFDKLAKRLEQEHHVKFHREWVRGGICIIRDEPTLRELVKSEIDKRGGKAPGLPMVLFRYRLKHR